MIPDTVPSSRIPAKSDQSMTLTGDEIQFMPVTITAGPSTTATDSPNTSTDSTAARTGEDASSAPISTTSTGGLPQMTANAGIALGAAAIVAAAF